MSLLKNGDRVIVLDKSRYGHTGTYVGVERTLVGWLNKVELDDGVFVLLPDNKVEKVIRSITRMEDVNA